MKTINKLTAMCMFLFAAACGNPAQNTDDANFKDSVTEALENGGKIDMDAFLWTREPAGYEIKGDTIAITTARTGSRDRWNIRTSNSSTSEAWSQTKDTRTGPLQRFLQMSRPCGTDSPAGLMTSA